MIDVKVLLARNFIGQGELYHFQGQYAEAKQHYEQALSYYVESHNARCGRSKEIYDCGACSANVISVESNIAKLYDNMGDYDEAKALYKKVVDIIDKIPADKYTVSTANMFVSVLSNLGELYHYKWREFPEANQYYIRAMNVGRRQLGEESFVILIIQAHQARLNLDQYGPVNKEAKTRAEVRYLEVVTAYKKAYKQSIPDAGIQLASWLNNLALIYYLHKNYYEARQRYREVENLYKDNQWTSHFSYAVFQTNYAQFLQGRNDDDDRREAHICYQSAERIYRDKSGEFYKFYQVADFLYDYASFFFNANARNYTTATLLLEKALDIYSYLKPCLGHDKVINALLDYKKYYSPFSGCKAPEMLYKHLLINYQKYGEQNNPQLTNVKNICASAYNNDL